MMAVQQTDVKMNHPPTQVVLEEMLVEDQPVALEANGVGPLRIPPGRKRFEFRYTGLSFTVPEKVRFQHRLAGLETEWVGAGTKRVGNYSYIPPGTYQFHVKACHNDGVWNDA